MRERFRRREPLINKLSDRIMLYIHIPYCRHKCIYCDFFSGGARVADWKRLRRALCAELEERVGELSPLIGSIYFGGGTPSLLPPEEFADLMEDMRRIMASAGIRLADDCEITLEANPEDVDQPHVSAWKSGGVNRVSLGVQTFSDSLLRGIGRAHSGDDAERSLRLLLSEFGNVSADLIFGLPGQSLADLTTDVERLVRLSPQHISVYTLMYEEGTALTALRNAGRLTEADESLVNDQYNALSEMLRDAGYEHYEISNYAVPGYRSRHNSGYWTGRPYLGIGPSAHSFDGRRIRRANPADLFGYLRHFAPEADVQSPAPSKFYTEEILSDVELREERIMLSLRRREGIDLPAFGEEFGEEELLRLLNAASSHIRAGRLSRSSNRLALTPSGLMIADPIILDLI